MSAMKRWVVAAIAVASFAQGGAARAATSLRSGDGIVVSSTRRIDGRLLAVRVSTRALTAPANVRILLPAGYAAHPSRRYPVLYLLHGTSGGAADWTALGDAERTTAGKPLIVVMPDIALGDDGGGWCTNWWRGTTAGRPRWETFHIDQLVPWIDGNLRTTRSRGGRAIAGLSQGGFCSMSYAARHPDVFGAALSYSGAPDVAWDPTAQALVTPVINAIETGLDHVAPNSIFGPRMTEEINWAAHDPATLAGNLRHTDLFLYTGNGLAGPLDHGPSPGASAIEAGVHELTRLFHRRLGALGIPSTYVDYGPGTHSWPYWARDLRQSIGPLMRAFAKHRGAPRQFDYTAAEARYSVYGWRVVMRRAVKELSTLRVAGAGGFVLEGSGIGTVTTAPLYRPWHTYALTARSRTALARAGAGGTLTIRVPLGPSNRVQEFPLDGPPIGTHVFTTRVTIRPR